ncbi:MAG: flippase [bacterium]
MDLGRAMGGRFLAHNTVLNVVGQGLPLIVGIAAMPFVTRGLGPARFGVLALAWALLGYMTIFDLGLGRASTKFVAEAVGRGDDQRIGSIAWTTVVAQAGLGVIGGLVLFGMTPLLVEHLLSIPEDLLKEARLSFYVLALSVPALLISGSLRGVLEAAQRFDLVNVVRAPLNSANFLLPLLGVFLGWHLPGLVALLIASGWLAVVVQYLLCRHLFPSFRGLPRFHGPELRRLTRYGGWLTLSSVVSPILVYLDRFMLGIFVSMAAVAYYAAPYEMVTRLLIVAAGLAATLFPAFSILGEQRNQTALEALVARSVKYLLLLVGPAVILVAVFAGDILRVWLGSDFAVESTPAVQILAVGVLLNSLALVPYSLIQALGRPDLTAKLHLAELPLHVVLVWVLVSRWGVPGAALAWTVRVFVDTVLLFVVAWRFSWLSPSSLLAHKVPHTAGVLVLLACSALSIPVLVPGTWLRLLTVAIAFVLIGVAAWRYLLDPRDRTQIVAVLRAARTE